MVLTIIVDELPSSNTDLAPIHARLTPIRRQIWLVDRYKGILNWYSPLFLEMLKSRTAVVIIHIIGWVIFLSLPFLFRPRFQIGPNGSEERAIREAIHMRYLISIVASHAFLMMFFYFNSYFLIPKFFIAKEYWYYAAAVIGALALYLVLVHLVSPGPPAAFRSASPDFPRPLFQTPGVSGPSFVLRIGNQFSIFLFVMIWALSTAIRVTEQWNKQETRATLAEADKLNAELSFLKAQVNPHFLYNTLNNIYTLALTKNEQTPNAIMQLSNMMRYVTEDAANDFVPLTSEVTCINDYINLQKIRLTNKTVVDYSVLGDIANKKIAPLLLMPFIENAFKYGVSNRESSPIVIRLQTEEKHLDVFVQNKKMSVERNNSDREGIGLRNVKKRLAHLYPDMHELNISEDGHNFAVRLKLRL